MTNSYVSLDVFKGEGVMNIAGDGGDVRMLSLLESVSRMVDRYCNRHFYVLEATRRFDGDGGGRLLVPDLVSIDEGGLKTDDDLDGVLETAWEPGEYVLLPLNADPASGGNPGSRPYTSVAVSGRAGSVRRWPSGAATVQIAGQWGWWRHLRRAVGTVGRVPDAAATGVTVSDQTGIEAGVTLLVDSEQIYVRSYNGTSLKVVRGVNGTAAAAHDAGSPVEVFEYPGPVVEAVILQASRLQRRVAGAVGVPDGGGGLDEDVRLMLGMYRKAALGVGV